jgi:DNA primase
MSVADDIKAKLDIVDYIQRYAPLKKAGRTYKCACVFHNERTPSMVVDPTRQTFKCFGCGAGGDIFSFAQKMHGWSFAEALQELGKLAGVEVRQQTPEERAKSDQLDALRGLVQAAADAYHEALFKPDVPGAAEALRYAREKRGLSDDTLKRFGVGYAPPGWRNMLDHLQQLGYGEAQIIEVGIAVRNEDKGTVYDRFRNRLIIPIRDERGRAIGFGGRILDPNDTPKYLNSPQTPLFDKSRTLFALDLAKHAIREGETAVIVEGYMDAVQAHQAGFTNVVAQMGTAITETQLKMLARSAKKIILALDSDAAGQNATRRSLEVARAALQADYSGKLSVDMRVLHIPDAKDPDDLLRETPERWRELVANAQPVADYVIDMEVSALPTNASVQEREGVARRLLPILLASENNLYNKDNVQKLALRLRIPERDLLAWAAEQERINKAKPPRPRPAPQSGRDRSAPAPGRDASGEFEPPPLDYDAMLELPPLEYDATRPAAARAMRPVKKQEAWLERQCLHLLFNHPEAYYAVNRKLRGLCEDRDDLRDGPLCDWGPEDFAHGDYRALMSLFKAGLEQDEMEPMDYLRAQLDETLRALVNEILIEPLAIVGNHVRGALKSDLMMVWKQVAKDIESVDPVVELCEKVLHIRINRLQREREEICFLQVDAQTSGDNEAAALFEQHIHLSMKAKLLIEVELHNQSNLLRE